MESPSLFKYDQGIRNADCHNINYQVKEHGGRLGGQLVDNVVVHTYGIIK